MLSRDQYIDLSAIPPLPPSKEWSDPIYMCPKCNEGGMCKNERYAYPTYPVQYRYRCDKCGFEEYLYI